MNQQQQKIYNAGLYYIKVGFSIIPVALDKKPLIQWKPYQERKTTVEEFNQWFNTYSDMQIGIVTGSLSGISVIDIDSPDYDILTFPETATVKTGGNGFHLYYKFNEKIKNVARIKEFIDIRSEGGFICAPPSYNLKGEYTWLKRIATVPFPIHLFKDEISKDGFNENFSKVDTNYEGFGKGNRNQEMVKYIGHILSRIHIAEWDTIAYPLIQQANQKNTPPLPENELKNSFNSICSRERLSNQNRWYNKNNKIQSSQEIIKDDLIVKKQDNARYTWGTRELDTNFAIIKRGNFIVFAAMSGAGKTTFAFDMAQKNALLGFKVLFISLEMDEKEVKESIARRRAGITIQEEYDNSIPNRKQDLFNNKIKEIDSIEYLFFKGVRRGGGLKWEQILDIIYSYKELDLIFIDNLDMVEGNRGEVDLERQKRIVKSIMGFTSDKQIPIILIHHYRKSFGGKEKVAVTLDDLSGSKKIVDGADRVFHIARCTNPEAVYPEKYKSIVTLQKGREYSNARHDVYFVRGSFEDKAPLLENYEQAGNIKRNRLDYLNE